MGALSSEDARVARTRRAVMVAAAALLQEEGVTAITHQRVAERAEVGRATVYRHWPRAIDLLFDVLEEVEEPLLRHGDGPLRAWLVHELRRVSIELSQPLAVQFFGALVSTAASSAAVGRLRDRLILRNVDPLAAAVERAVREGELKVAPAPEDLLAQLLGPIIFRVVLHGTSADGLIEPTIDAALAPWQ